SVAAMITVIEALDRFLIGIVLLYFGFGIYSLFIRPESSDQDPALPSLLQVRQIGQLKQVVAEVIIVILFVLFLRNALEAFQSTAHEMTWRQIATFLVLPVSAALLGLSLRLVELHPKPHRPATIMTTKAETVDERMPLDG
ncbi:MAG: YqhA family protein, partial [Hyphomicrobiaceae bacterium]